MVDLVNIVLNQDCRRKFKIIEVAFWTNAWGIGSEKSLSSLLQVLKLFVREKKFHNILTLCLTNYMEVKTIVMKDFVEVGALDVKNLTFRDSIVEYWSSCYSMFDFIWISFSLHFVTSIKAENGRNMHVL